MKQEKHNVKRIVSRQTESDRIRLKTLIDIFEQVLRDLALFETTHTAKINRLHRAYELSARNLLHYVALVKHDLFAVRETLASMGLSSLGRVESHVVASLQSVLRHLYKIANLTQDPRVQNTRRISRIKGIMHLEAHSEALFGPSPAKRRTRIMVTFPSEAARDYRLVRLLIEKGMDCARINCAHDGAPEWERMCANVRRAEQELGRRCRILMDLAGPKLRTGTLEKGPRVLRVRPERDLLGAVVHPGRVWLTGSDAVAPAPAGVACTLPVDLPFIKAARNGDTIVCRDVRNKLRRLRVDKARRGGLLALTESTVYFVPGTRLHLLRRGRRVAAEGTVADLPAAEKPLVLCSGDMLMVTADPSPGKTADGLARISCTLPSIFADVKAGERICFDDGRITGVIEKATSREMTVRITMAKPGGSKLRSDKGINLPDSNLQVAGLTAKDVADLEFVARHADLVALSFVRDPSDIAALHRRLAQLGGSQIGVVLKIETRRAIRRLPALILEAMASHPIGVMIARGDLAVEIGFDNLAEAQEEILRVCEAGHVPVIWATQVLENLAKSGMPSRAEISDAAMAVRAECVMLNKGPYITSALAMLDAILRRMQRHSLDKVDHRYEHSDRQRFVEGLVDEKESKT